MIRQAWALGLCLLALCGCSKEKTAPAKCDRALHDKLSSCPVDETDAGTADAGTADATSPLESAYVDCQSLKAGRVPRGMTLLEDFEGASVLAANAHSLFGLRGDEIWTRSTTTRESHVVAYLNAGTEPNMLVADGDELFFDPGAAVSKVRIAGGVVVSLTSKPLAVGSLLVTDDAVFWLGTANNGGTGAATLLRSDREPGTTRSLATFDGPPLGGSLVRIGDALYFAVRGPGYDDPPSQLYRFDLGAQSVLPFGQPAPIAALATDGETLFAGLTGTPDALGNAVGMLGVHRVHLDDGTFEPLFAQFTQAVRMLSVDQTDVYWMSDAAGTSAALVRGDKTGAGEPVVVAQGWPGSTGLAQNEDGVFWTVPCLMAGYVMRAAK